ncbi:pteridine reductase [Leeia oryzae]|uniref:pteridine reductase n=1 Tax=Leeia oryzae TaxID=356662 RepID=UPI00035CF9ED|nr:pteridine reductase [Leeia oryzae]
MTAHTVDASPVVLITGAAKRVGACITRALHSRGLRVAIHYRHAREDAVQLTDELNLMTPGSAACFQADLLDTDALTMLVADVVTHFGQLDYLVNNASSFFATPLGEITDAHWDDLIGSNLKSPLWLSQAAMPHLRKQQGAIVNMADIHAERPMRGHVVYSIAKAGIVAMTKSLAGELGPDVRVNAVAPGVNLWPEHHPGFDDATRAEILSRTFLQRAGTPDDLAGAVTFLLLDAPYITGHVLNVDGGRSVYL